MLLQFIYIMEQLSKSKLHYFSAFLQKKHKDSQGMFVVEGTKMIEELVRSGIDIHTVVATKSWFEAHSFLPSGTQLYFGTEQDLTRLSNLKSAPQSWALAYKKTTNTALPLLESELVIALDCVQDPGNVGTIIRTAEWFGVRQIWCSPDTADMYNSKVLHASMGSAFRMHIVYTDLPTILRQQINATIITSMLQGESLYTHTLPDKTILVMGNEGNGIRKEIEHIHAYSLHIPQFAAQNSAPESLNVAIATAIFCSEFKKKTLR